jgi:hypothetical protein
MSEYGEFITPKESIALYREIETKIEGLDNSKTNDTAYRARVYEMLKKGVQTNGEEGVNLRISRDHFISGIGEKINRKLGASKTKVKKIKKRSKKSSSTKKKSESKYLEYKNSIREGKSHEDTKETLGIDKILADSYRRSYARWGNK